MKKIYFGLALLASSLSIGTFGQGTTCATAVVVTPGTYFADGPSSGGGAINNDGGVNADWYSFTAPCNGVIDISSCISGMDTDLFLYDNTCPASEAETIAQDDDGCFLGCCMSELNSIPVTAGTTYYIEWGDEWSSSAFSWELTYAASGVTGVTSNPTNTTAFLNWNPAGAETDWTVEYGIAGFVPGTGTVVNVLVSDATITGLNPLTSYDFYIMAGVGPCNLGPFSFTTLPLCPQPTLPNVTLITTDAATLNWTAGGLETMWDVEWDVDGFLLGTGIQDFGLLANSDALTGLTSLTDYHWYVRAVCDLNIGDGIDTVSFFVGPNSFSTGQICTNPSALNVSGVTGFETDLTWSAGGLETEWNVQWGELGFTVGGLGSNLIANTPSFPSLTGLVPNTTYQYYVQAVCGSTPDSLSFWVGPFTWNTAVYCNDPSGLTSSMPGTTTTTISWTAGGLETDWTYEYGLNGFTPGTGTTVQTISTTANLTGLTPGMNYCYYVQSNCGATQDSSSNWVGPYCFNTIVACPPPTNLGVINITNTAANLLWQAGGVETMWNVEWGLQGFNPGVGEEEGSVTGTTTNPHYVTGLNASNSYEFYVQADCGGGNGTSTWTGPYFFSTLFVNDIPCDAIEIPLNGVVNTHNNTLATNNGEGAVVPGPGACDDNMSWCGFATADAPMWFKFKASASGAAHISTENSVTSTYGNHTEIAVYSVGLCENYSSYTLLAANTGSTLTITGSSPYAYIMSDPGSNALICSGLTPGEDYYIMVDAFTGPGDDVGGWFNPNYTAFQGYFGISVAEISTVDAGTSVGATLCEDAAGAFDLFTTITGNTSTNGTWYNPNVAPGNELPNLLDFTGIPAGDYPFFYVDGSTCISDTVETFVTVEAGPVAGNDNAVTACNSGDIYLIQYLTGFPEMGGTWNDDDATGNLVNGIFQSYGHVAGVFDFTYTVTGTGACPPATATVTVTLDDCLGLGIGETSNNSLSVYPNPVVDILTIQNLSIEGNAVIEVLDVQGKVVTTTQVAGVYGNYNLDMKNVMSGVYIVRITSENSVQEARIVKQ